MTQKCVHYITNLKALSLSNSCFLLQPRTSSYDLHCHCGVLHLWTAVLRLPGDRMGRCQGQIHHSPHPGELRHEDSSCNCRSSARHCGSYHLSLHRTYRCLLLLYLRAHNPSHHWNCYLLGCRFRCMELGCMEKYPCRHIRSICSSIRIKKCICTNSWNIST